MFQKYVQVNKRDLRKAIVEGMRPMQTFFDTRHGDIPFFGNLMTEPGFGNSHHSSFSIAHMPGRWLNALLSAEAAIGEKANENAIARLSKWACRSMEATDMGFPACVDVETLEVLQETDLHNLRECMHAFYALVKYREDKHAYRLALRLMDTVDEYFDDERAAFHERRWEQDKRAKCQHWGETYRCASPFPLTVGRYIGPLVKFYLATGEPKALAQAIRLKNACFAHVLNARGNYDVEIFGTHTHSTTAMISSLAQFGDALGDKSVLERVHAFMNNGLKQIAIDTGWCIEGDRRTDDVGEINNTSDIMETCLILARHGYPGYFARAERILRAHFLPAQLLDTHFIPHDEDEGHVATYRLDERAVGAFGFPCPSGHEYEEGAPISFNWDIVGGGVGGLCEAYQAAVTNRDGHVSVNLLFDMENGLITFRNPYDGQGTARVTANEELRSVRIRVPTRCKGISCEQKALVRDGEWAYLGSLSKDECLQLSFEMETDETFETFRGRTYIYRWLGEEVVAMPNQNKRLMFFKNA